MASERKRPIVPRRHQRRRLTGNATIFWTGERGEVSCSGNCIDVSAYGLLLEIPEAIPVGAVVQIQLPGSTKRLEANVRQQRKYCGWHRIGLKFPAAISLND